MSGIIDVNSYIKQSINNFEIIEFKYFKEYKRSRQPFYKVKCLNCNKNFIIGLWSIKKKNNDRYRHCKKHHCQLPDKEASINAIFRSYQRAAKIRNYNFELTKIKFLEIINKNCHYCNAYPSNKARNQNNTGNYYYNGIDRVDNSKGYIEENVVPCCINCNRAKSDMHYENFLKWIKNIYNNLK